MQIKEYINFRKQLCSAMVQYIEGDKENEENLIELVQLVKENKISENKEEMKHLIRLILSTSNNHYRNSDFFTKIEKIILHFQEEFKKIFSNEHLYDLFKQNKRILLFLFESGIIEKNDKIIESILNGPSYFSYYFFNIIDFDEQNQEQIKNSFLSQDPNSLDEFETKQKNGENGLSICKLIREDLIDDFVVYVNKRNLSLSGSTITNSYFETHPFLSKKVTLIEYSAFFGSIQIFQYLRLNDVEMTPSIWMYAIHGHNPEIIHIIESNGITLNSAACQKCFEEAIKCHHNEYALYIRDNLLVNDPFVWKSGLCSMLENHNFALFPDEFDSNFLWFYACKYDYLELVKLILEYKEVDINSLIVLIYFYVC